MQARKNRLQLPFVICVSFVCVAYFVFALCTSHFDLEKNNELAVEANINQNYPNIRQFILHYWPTRNIGNTETTFYEMKYGQSIFYEKLPSWDYRNLLKQTHVARYKAFDQRITGCDYKEFVDILEQFKALSDMNNLTFMLYGGSLLGSFRHFGVIPWDDDIDVFMNTSDKQRLLKVLVNTSKYAIHSPSDRQWKFYKKRKINTYNCTDNSEGKMYAKHITWPYVDIFFFLENDTHIWDENSMYSSTYIFHKKDIFPLTFGLFEHLIVHVPRCTENVLSKTYNIELCVTSVYSHKYETQSTSSQLSLPCKRLYNFFPFVFGAVTGRIVYRKLVINGKVLYGTISNNMACLKT
ncbi:uncharacterized protein LOC132746907 [Ruditapes philippinarum]|uniref:uncharacterized protein LOC132746907 n=1 Tax=Ruditapes philippinarum TaxID=129788 RepID=UPI00295B58D0|nr:uncharacterized protein LOC132746907 [Ruditapes philippinarum]